VLSAGVAVYFTWFDDGPAPSSDKARLSRPTATVRVGPRGASLVGTF
jgi:hypothetical protein